MMIDGLTTGIFCLGSNKFYQFAVVVHKFYKITEETAIEVLIFLLLIIIFN